MDTQKIFNSKTLQVKKKALVGIKISYNILMTMVAEIMTYYMIIYRQRTQNLIHTSIAIPLVIKQKQKQKCTLEKPSTLN